MLLNDAHSSTNGSILLVVLLFLSMLLAVGVGIWYKIGFLVDLNGICYRNEQQYQATAAALYWTVALYKEHTSLVHDYLHSHPHLSFSLHNWFDKSYTAYVTLKKDEQELFLLTAHLQKEGTPLQEINCSMRTRYDKKKKRMLVYLFNWHQVPHR